MLPQDKGEAAQAPQQVWFAPEYKFSTGTTKVSADFWFCPPPPPHTSLAFRPDELLGGFSLDLCSQVLATHRLLLLYVGLSALLHCPRLQSKAPSPEPSQSSWSALMTPTLSFKMVLGLLLP